MTNLISIHQNKNALSLRRQRVRNSKRLLFAVVVLVLIGYLLGLTSSLAFSSTTHIDKSEYIIESVVYGDTLWTVAAKHCDDNTNIQSFIHDIAAINHLDNNCTLTSGQELIIPVLATAKHN